MSVGPVSVGPVDFFVLGFPGSQSGKEIVSAIQELVDRDTIRIIDILFAVKEGDDDVRIRELDELAMDLFQRFDPVVAEVAGVLTPDDVRHFARDLPPDSTLALLLFENTWARKVADEIQAADGRVVLFERIPRPVIQQLFAERERLMSEPATS